MPDERVIDSPWPQRLGAWLVERFPPGPYTVLVVLFHVAAVVVARALGGGGFAPTGALVIWLVFLHLRIYDEHKDYAADRVAYPDRVLSRGIVTLPMLGRLGAAAVSAEAALAALLGPRAFVAWAAVFAFSVAMRFEFGLGDALRDRLVPYAITHNPIVALLALFAWAATGATWDPRYLWFVALVSVGSLGFELGRKTRKPGEEHAGVASYTTDLGQEGARALLAAVHVGTGVALGGLAASMLGPIAAIVGLIPVIPGLATVTGRAKVVDAGASVVLLVALLVAIVVGALA